MDKEVARDGLEASFRSLVQCRPDRKVTGFAPGGKVRTHQYGSNRSVYRGRGMEFDEARAYQPGDDARAIDWRVTARTGSLHTKLFHEERERPVLFLVDLRRSMQFGTKVQFKSVLAAKIAAALAWTGIDGGDRVGGFISTPAGVRTFPATRNTSTMLAFIKALSEATRLEGDPADTTNNPEVPLHASVDRLRHVARPGTLVFIISDFADYDEQTARSIKRLSLHAHVTNVLVFDQLETSLPHGAQRISDGDAVTALSALGNRALSEHVRLFDQRRARIETISRQRGMSFLAVATSATPSDVLRLYQGNTSRRAKDRRKAA